jgi:gliding motility-associated-like protein
VNSWSWDFGDMASNTDVSTIQNPTYQYPNTGTRSVRLIASSSLGCKDTMTKVVNVTDLPLLRLPFHDTLICTIDTLQLKAEGVGKFDWSPAYNIINPKTANPLVYPKNTTTYVVTLDENGCSTKDSIKVNTLSSIAVNAGADTTICTSDTITLKPFSQALQYQWTPTVGMIGNANVKNPVIKPMASTTYTVVANLGKCQAQDAVNIKVVDYPAADAGPDLTICYGERTTLAATMKGSTFNWTPSQSLLNPNSLTPVAAPNATTTYVLTVNDTQGCPKPSTDAVVVTVVPPLKVFAGNDTSIVANQPLQLNAIGGDTYLWTPSVGLSNSSISNPLATLGPTFDSIIYKVRASVFNSACFAEDEIKVKVFKTPPDIFIPTAFTPNNDGKNDMLKPIPVGIKDFVTFKIYNRWGQLLYSTSTIGRGWDGNFNGIKQATGTYIFMAEAVDYLGKPLFKKGTVVLIR